MKTSGIYQIQSKIHPERIYMGSALDINGRWRAHLYDLRKNKHHSIKLQRHFNKYSEVDLQFSVLLKCEKQDLIKIEQKFLDTYNPYFNICKIAGSTMGISPSKEARKKMSESKKGHTPWNKGKKATPEARLHQGEAHKGLRQPEEMNKRRSATLKGRPSPMKGRRQTNETCNKMAETHKKRWEEHKNPIYQYDLDMIFIKEWPDSRDAGRAMGVSNDSIKGCLRGNFKTAYGFIWKYKFDSDARDTWACKKQKQLAA